MSRKLRIYRSTLFVLALLSPILLLAQFGKNKLQYQKLRWYVYSTNHFDIYYPEGCNILAQFTAAKATAHLPRIEQTLGHVLSEKIPIVVYPSQNMFQETNIISPILPEGVGGFTELLKNRVVIPYDGNWYQFEHVIVHELVHGVINQMFYGGSLQSVLLRTNVPELPLWMNEGLCEYISLNGLDRETDMFLRDLVISEQLPPLQYLDGYLAYRGGQSFYWFIEQRYGKRKITELLQRLLLVKRLSSAIQLTFNKDLEEFSEEWMKFLKKRYWNDFVRFQDIEEIARQLTNHRKEGNFYNSSPALSPKGEKLAFLSDRDGVFSLYLMDLSTPDHRVRKLVSSQRSPDFEELNILTPGISWSPDGRYLAVAAKYQWEDVLYLYDTRTDQYIRKSWGFQKLHGIHWASDGDRIAFSAVRNNQSDIFLWIISKDTLLQLTDDYYTDQEPVWKGNSGIFFISDRSKQKATEPWKWDLPRWDVYYFDLSTKDIQQITTSPHVREYALSYIESQNSLLLISDLSGIANLYEYSLDDSTLKAITNFYSPIYQFSTTSNGDKIVVAAQTGGGYDLYMMRRLALQPLEIGKLEYTDIASRKLQQNRAKAGDTLRWGWDTQEQLVALANGKVRVSFSKQKLVLPKEKAGTIQVDTADAFSFDTLNVKPYRVHFSPDIILGTAGYDTYFGVLGQVQMLFSDMLGDHQVYVAANLLYDISNSDFFIEYAYLPQRSDYYFLGFHTARFALLNSDLYRFRYAGLGMMVQYPFDRFHRLEMNFLGVGTFTENIDFPAISSNTYHFLTEARYVYDDVLWTEFYEVYKGLRYYFDLALLPEFLSSSLDFYTISADLRYYLPLFSRYYSLAFRLAGAGSFGKKQQQFFLLGTDQWLNPTYSNNTFPFSSAEDLFFLSPIYPVRGAAVNELNGRYFLNGNAEFRFPLIRLFVPGALPILLQNIRAAIFSDFAIVWNDTLQFFETLNSERRVKDLFWSIGIGSRVTAFGLPVRIDIAWKYLGEKFSRPIWLFSLGYPF